MTKAILIWQIVGFFFSVFLGSFLHFAYKLSNNSIIVGTFSAINESTWEHMKLLFFPMFIFSIIQFFFFRNVDQFWNIKLCGICIGLTLIPVLFYMYNGIIGKSPAWINIAIFASSAFFAYLFELKAFKDNRILFSSQTISFYILLFIAFLFIFFTFITPKINIFKDPVTGKYGI